MLGPTPSHALDDAAPMKTFSVKDVESEARKTSKSWASSSDRCQRKICLGGVHMRFPDSLLT